jgi:hypothetical protein
MRSAAEMAGPADAPATILAGWLAFCVASSLMGTAPQARAASDERVRLEQQRRQMVESFAAEARACEGRFAVTSCVDDVRRRQREALAPLRERQLLIEETWRAQRATERKAAIEARLAAAAAAPAASVLPPQLRIRTPEPAASRATSRTRDDADDRAAQADQRQRQAQRRREEAAAAQQRVQRRLDDRAASERPVAPLPVPPPASAPRP